MQLDVPVVAVTVHPANARVTRRGTVEVPAGTTELAVADLPALLLDESVRAAGRAATPVRIVGVDVRWADLAQPDGRVGAAEAALAQARRELAAVEAAEAGDTARLQLLEQLSIAGGKRLATAFAEGDAELGRIAELGAAVTEQVAQATVSRQGHQERRAVAQREVDAAQAGLDRLVHSGPVRRVVAITVEADEPARLDVELSYVVEAASWTTTYDARLGAADEVAITWYAMINQTSGEDWPECEVTLSTARPARTATLPELDPWWVDVHRPPMPRSIAPTFAAETASDTVAGAAPAAPAMARAKALEAAPVAETEHTVAGAWRLARPVAVPSDDAPHRTTVTTMAFPARLDHVVAPAQSLDAYLRATLTNSGSQVLLAGPVATFLDDAFVGTSRIEQTAPGAEIELALGVDDRIVVERELVDRTARKARFGSQRSSVETWRTTVANRRPNPANVIVRDRVPVTRNADLKIVDVALTPDPAEQDDLGRVEWSATIAPGATWTATARFGVESPKDVPLTGWR